MLAPTILNDDDARWACVQSRRPASSFVYAVKTTKIFCRPDCPARLARRANVVFFDRGSDASKSGFRACKRCKPTLNTTSASPGLPTQSSEKEDLALAPGEQNARRRAAAKAKRVIEASEGLKSWKQVAQDVGLSPRYLFEAFKAIEGVTPGVFSENIKRSRKIANRNEMDELSKPQTAGTVSSLDHIGVSNAAPPDEESYKELNFGDNDCNDLTPEYIDRCLVALYPSTTEGIHSLKQSPSSWTWSEMCSSDSLGSENSANTPIQDLFSNSDNRGPVDCLTWPMDTPFDDPIAGGMSDDYIFDDDWTNLLANK